MDFKVQALILLIQLNLMWVFLNLKLNNAFPQFKVVILNLIWIVSLYAVLKTGAKTIYIVPFLWIPILWIRNGISRPQIYSGAFKHLIVVNVIWLIFFVIYSVFAEGSFHVPQDDYITYGRIAFYNDLFGKENTMSYYNLLFKKPKIEIYHHFELWLMNLSNSINNIERLPNSLFFSFPLFASICTIGLKDITGEKNLKVLIFLTLILLLITNPYDYFRNSFGFKLPYFSLFGSLLSLKYIVILPIFLYLISSLKDRILDYEFIFLLVFIYPLTAPVVLPGVLIFSFITRNQEIKKLLIPGLLCILIAVVLYAHTSVDVAYQNDIQFGDFLKIFYLSFILPAIIFLPVYTTNFEESGISKKNLIIFLASFLPIGLCLWVLKFNHIDSRQLHYNSLFPIISIIASLAIWVYLKTKRYVVFLFFIFLFICPFFLQLRQTNFISADQDAIKLSAVLPAGSKIAIIPDTSYAKSVFQYNERMSFSLNSIYILREDIHLINTTSTFPIKKKLQRDSLVAKQIKNLRSISPIFNDCGEMDCNTMTCIKSFMLKNGVKYILFHKSAPLCLTQGNDLKKVSGINLENYLLFKF
jgi:hypothetical protein